MTIVRYVYILLSIVLPVLTILLALMWPPAWWAFIILGPLLLLGTYDLLQRKHTVLRLYPIIGHFRYIFEYVRPEMQQYFVEDDISGRTYSNI